MKKLNGNNVVINLILSITFILICSCSPEKQYSSTLSFENKTNQSVTIIAYGDYDKTKEDWVLLVHPQEFSSMIVTRYSSEDIFETTTFIKLLFNDGRYILYDRDNSYLESKTNLFNLSIYQNSTNNNTYKLQITEDHYNETHRD